MCGDYNIDLLKVNKVHSYDMYFNDILSAGYIPTITLPTRLSTSSTLIDNIFTTNISKEVKAYLSSAVYIFRFQDGVYLAIYTCQFRWCYGHFYNRLTQFIVYCSYVVCTILLRRPVDLSTHWTVTAISLHVTTFVGVCHE